MLIATGLLVLAFGALVAVDLSRADRIADGVSVAGTPVGGLTAEEAAVVLREEVAAPVERTVVAVRGGDRHELSPDEAELEVDVDATVADAMGRGPGRPPGVGLLVELFGGNEADVDLDPRISYSEGAVSSFVEDVAAEVDREPRDAEVDPSADGLRTVEERDGLATDRDELHSRAVAAIESFDEHQVDVPVERVRPETTLADLAERYPHYITIDRDNFRLYHFEDLERESVYGISVGDVGHHTPAGRYDISDKAVDPTWHVPDSEWAGDLAGEVIPPGPDNPIKSRWLGIEDGIGIHGTDETDSIGERASRGCIRMLIPDVEELYDAVPAGTPVYIG